MISNDKRLQLALPIVESARTIAAGTAVALAKDCWQHLVSTGVIVNPEQAVGDLAVMTVIRVLNPTGRTAQKTPVMPIIALQQSDHDFMPAVAKMVDLGTDRALYQSDNNGIFLKLWQSESTFVWGCTLLHEAGHSLRAVTEGRIGDPPPVRSLTNGNSSRKQTSMRWNTCYGKSGAVATKRS